jgi:hypothetical protein
MRRKLTYDPARDYYTLLGIDSQATPDDIKQAYRRSVRQAHPDLNPDRADWATEQIQLINEAYDTLRNPARRRQYDRQRWLHVPAQAPSEEGYRSPFGAPDYDPNRPWWEHVAEHAPRQYPLGEDFTQVRDPWFDSSPPFWVSAAHWLRQHRLGFLEARWLTLVGLWRSPYRGVLITLVVALGINVAAIIYVASSPNRWASVREWLAEQDDQTAVAQPTLTPERLRLTCNDPGVQITAPYWGDVVEDQFVIYGTVQRADLWNYQVMVGFVGQAANITTAPTRWIEVRPPPRNQSIPEPPLVDAPLTEQPVDLAGQPEGYYAIRLRVTLRSGEELPPCDVVVRH